MVGSRNVDCKVLDYGIELDIDQDIVTNKSLKSVNFKGNRLKFLPIKSRLPVAAQVKM